MYFIHSQNFETSHSDIASEKKPFMVYKIFQMDYNRNTKEYRMLDCFLPQVRTLLSFSIFKPPNLINPKGVS